MTLLALGFIALGIWLFDALCPKIQVSGSPYNWPRPLQILTVISAALVIGGMITVGVFPVIG
ncbi:hypothetical protein ACIQCN_14955 [Pseudarthrobacter sp. NPDC092424]|uniref:hypothetical protein n=1 Tax=Pseudarthrobacter sp. NPDC092424 TaxID=3364415 RepID=UPI00380105A0